MGKTGERRLSRRYRVSLAIQFRISDGRTMSKWRAGKICDMSTGGVIFRCGQALPVNAQIEMVIDWPPKHDNLYPICLRAAGHVVRSQGRKTAVRMTFCRMVIEKASPELAAIASSLG
jgi:hypothetical protein